MTSYLDANLASATELDQSRIRPRVFASEQAVKVLVKSELNEEMFRTKILCPTGVRAFSQVRLLPEEEIGHVPK